MPFAKVTIAAKILTPARTVPKQKKNADGQWVKVGDQYEYAYLHEGADIIAGKITTQDATLKPGEEYLIPLRVEFRDQNIRLDDGVAIYPVVPPKAKP